MPIINGKRIGGGGAGLDSQHNNQPPTTGGDMTIYRLVWRSSKEEEEEEKEKGKSDFSSLSFDAAAVAFGLALTQQPTRGGAMI